MARILLGVTGGIAAYKACSLVRLLVRSGHDVHPLVTVSAERFVAARTFFALAGKTPSDDPYPHLERADILVVAPLTANTLARLAHGLADDLLTEAALAHDGPVALAPAMNVRMWQHPATQANVQLLRERGVEFVGPVEGELAEGEVGMGRMAEPEAIAVLVEELVGSSSDHGPLRGRRVLVTAGGTREPLDSVRFFGNRSSGRMGVALAEEALRRGADVTLLAANLAVSPPTGVTVVDASTAADLERETLARADAEVIVMAAAVADYRPSEPLAAKRPKDGVTWSVELEPTDDILAELGRRRRADQVLVGFAAEVAGPDGLERARRKRAAKGADLVVYNDVSRADIGFETAENEVVLLREDSERSVPKAPKRRIAAEILDEVEYILADR